MDLPDTAMSNSNDLATFLADVGLTDFIGIFMAEGVMSIDDLKLLSEADMKELGLNIGQRNRLKNALSRSHSSWHTKTLLSNDEPTAEERDSYMEVFNAIDTDNSGEIDFDEFVAALKKMDIFESEMKARHLFNQADEDCGGTLDREEFSRLMQGAKNGNKAAELERMAKAGKDVMSQLNKSLGLTISVEDALEAPITEAALSEVEAMKGATWIIQYSECNETDCTFVLNVLVLDMDLLKKMMGIVCMEMLEELEKKLQELGISGFIQSVNVEAVVGDGLRGFADIIHRFSHTYQAIYKQSSLVDLPSRISYLHSVRKAAIIVAASDSVQEVRDAAADFARRVYESQGQGMRGSSSISGGLAKSAANGIAIEAGSMALEAAVSSGCSIM